MGRIDTNILEFFDQRRNIKNHLLRRGSFEALDLFVHMERRAVRKPEYREKLYHWLRGGGTTIYLRDELAAPFKGSLLHRYYEKTIPCAFDNMWIPIDSASIHKNNEAV